MPAIETHELTLSVMTRAWSSLSLRGLALGMMTE
jgi:hypothetical protein